MTLNSVLPVIWLTFILAAIFAEAYSERLIAIWFAPAALISLVCGFFGVPAQRQGSVFLLSAIVMITAAQTVRRIVCRSDKHNQTDRDIE